MKISSYLSQIIVQKNHLVKITTAFENKFEGISVSSIIKITKFEPGTAFEKNIYYIKADLVKIITSLDMNLLSITSIFFVL